MLHLRRRNARYWRLMAEVGITVARKRRIRKDRINVKTSRDYPWKRPSRDDASGRRRSFHVKFKVPPPDRLTRK